MFTGRRYLLDFTPEQAAYAEQVGGACRAVWNVALEQRREYRRRGAFINYVEQARQMAAAKSDPDCAWLADAPSHTLQQMLRDLGRACREHGTWKVRWRSKSGTAASFRFPDPKHLAVERVSKRWGRVRLPKFGWVRFRWPWAVGEIRNATVTRDGGRWFVSFCVDDGIVEVLSNGKPAVGVDRGVKVAVATSDGRMLDREFVTPGEATRLRRLQQRLARQRNKRSNRRKATRAKLVKLNATVRHRRADFAAQTATDLTRSRGLVVVEDLRMTNMTASAKGTSTEPGRKVRQKAGLNRAILAKGWGGFLLKLEHAARYHGSTVVKINPAFTSQTCNACGHVAPENRESQAVFRCVACGRQADADVNAARNILAAGLAVTGRGDLAVGRSAKRQPPGATAA